MGFGVLRNHFKHEALVSVNSCASHYEKNEADDSGGCCRQDTHDGGGAQGKDLAEHRPRVLGGLEARVSRENTRRSAPQSGHGDPEGEGREQYDEKGIETDLRLRESGQRQPGVIDVHP